MYSVQDDFRFFLDSVVFRLLSFLFLLFSFALPEFCNLLPVFFICYVNCYENLNNQNNVADFLLLLLLPENT